MTTLRRLRPYVTLWREDLRGAWHAFKRWRRERWPVRVVIIVLLGSYAFAFGRVGPFAPGLVRVQIEGIFHGCEGGLVTAGARFHKARETDGLRRSLRVCLDADRDGAIGPEELRAARELGLAPADIEGRALDADLDRLVVAARASGLVPPSHTAKRIRREAFHVGQGEADRVFGPAREEIDRLIDGAEPSPRNWSLSTWCDTAVVTYLLWTKPLGLADCVTAVALLFLSYLTARLVVLTAGERARCLAACIPPGVMLSCSLLALVLYEPLGIWFRIPEFRLSEFFARAAGGVLFSFFAACRGGRVAPEDAGAASVLRTTAHIGGVLFVWGTLSTLVTVGAYEFTWRWWLHSYFLTWLVPFSAKILGIVTGAALVVWADTRMLRMSRADGDLAVA